MNNKKYKSIQKNNDYKNNSIIKKKDNDFL